MTAFMVVCGLVAAVSSSLLECGKLVVRPIYRSSTGFFKLQSNLNALRKKMQDLAHLRDEVNQQVEEGEKNGRGATHQAREWQEQVGEVLTVAQEIMVIADGQPNAGCFFKCGLSRKVSYFLKEVERLVAADAYPTQLVLTNRQVPMVEQIPVISVASQPTASRNLAKLMELLYRDEVRSIGVWGMGGVGKTTLLKNLNNKLHSLSTLQPFGKVIWSTISKDMNYKLIQARIAARLGFDLKDGDQVSMASQLHARLLKEEKFLIVLDDVWERIDFDRLGIPHPQVHKGCKILLTSRSQAICNQMSMDELFKVAILNVEEAWILFSTRVGEVATLKEIVPFAREVARECHGLPLAIMVVGAAMRRKDRLELWKDALNELRWSRPSIPGIEKEVFNALKWSYDSLQAENIKSCFLLCCLYHEDYQIDISELVQCCLGEGMIDVGSSYEHALNRGVAMIENLKDACLLEHGENDWLVTMHGLVRDVGIWIAASSRDVPKSLVLPGFGLPPIMGGVEANCSLKRVSLINNKITKLPDDFRMMQFPETMTLFLQANEFSEETLEGVLQGFRAIRVLNLANTSIISSLPHSTMQLVHLRALFLNGCGNLKELPTSGWEGLTKVQVLDLSETDIREVPIGVKMLINLRELHLVNTKGLLSIPTGLFTMLSSLEVLNMEGSKYLWGVKVQVGDGKAYLEELENLNKLRALCIRMKCETSLNSRAILTVMNRLAAFRVTIGWKPNLPRFHGAGREVCITGVNVAEDERFEYWLCTNATCLRLLDCTGLDTMVQNLALNATAPFSALNSLTIWRSASTFSPTRQCDVPQHDLLPNLEHLCLTEIADPVSISQLFGHLGLRLSKLKDLTLCGCFGMKHLLSLGGRIQTLESLVEIVVTNCPGIEELFQYDNNVVDVVPNLRKILLYDLPELRTVCRQRGEWPNVEKIVVRGCPELKKLPLTSQNKNTVKEIRGEALWWSQLEWDDITTKDSLHPFFQDDRLVC